MIAQNDSYGRDLLVGLKRGLAGGSAKVIAAQNYEVTASEDVGSQIAKLKKAPAPTRSRSSRHHSSRSGGRSFANKLGWKPFMITNVVCSASNVVRLA